MKDQENQIEEMASDMDYACTKRDLYPSDAKEIAKALYLLNYRKIDKDSVVLSGEEYIDLSRNYVGEQITQAREQAIKDFAESICRELWNVGVDDNGKQFKYGDLTSKDVWRIAKRQLGAETKE